MSFYFDFPLPSPQDFENFRKKPDPPHVVPPPNLQLSTVEYGFFSRKENFDILRITKF